MSRRQDKKTKIVRAGNDPILNSGHGAPTTRRQMLSRGFIMGTGTVLVPSLFSFAAQKAYGQELDCGGAAAGGNNARLPYLQFDYAGGWVAAKHFIVTGAGGPTDFITDEGARSLGLPPEHNPLNDPAQVNTEIGIPMYASSSWLMGFKAKTSETTRANINGRILAVRSRDDSRRPEWGDIIHNILKSGQTGSIVAAAGTSDRGGRYDISPAALSTNSPVQIESFGDTRNIVSRGLIDEILTDEGQAMNLLKAMQRTSRMRLQAFLEADVNKQLQVLVECGYAKSVENLTAFTPDGIDPGNDALVTQVLQLDNSGNDATINNAFNLDDGDDESVLANAKLVLDGYAGTGTVEIGGHDNHGRNAAQQNQKDFESGAKVGMAMELAALKGQPLMITICTDGAQASRNQNPDDSDQGMGRMRTNSDNGERSCVVMLAYSPNGRPVMGEGGNQGGALQKTNGAVDQAAAEYGNDVIKAAQQVANEFLALQGKAPAFNTGDKNGFTSIF